MTRQIVQHSDGARHPFRRGLPHHVTSLAMPLAPVRSSDGDWKLFCVSFAAFFTLFYSFVS